MTQSLTPIFFRAAGRHFVSMSCLQRLPNGNEKALVFSGFIVEISDEWFYVTAGHILQGIESAMAAGATFDVWRLDDQSAGNRFKGIAVPFDFDESRWLVLAEEANGLDYAVVHIGGLVRKQLEAGGVVAIGKAAWGSYADDHDHWGLLGVPSESVDHDGKSGISARLVCVALKECEPHPRAGSKAQNQFFAEMNEDSVGYVADADGMSGGPIFALKKIGGEWTYKVIGVQSAWYDQSRVIAACPFSTFGDEVERIVTSTLKGLPPHAPTD